MGRSRATAMGQSFAWSWAKGTNCTDSSEGSVGVICGQAVLLLSYISRSYSSTNQLWSQERCAFPAMEKFPFLALIQNSTVPSILQNFKNKTSFSLVQIWF